MLSSCEEPFSGEVFDATKLAIPNRSEKGSLGGTEWKQFTAAAALNNAWSPAEGTVWRSYAKPTLVSAISILPEQFRYPCRSKPEEDGRRIAASIFSTIKEKSAVICDLPGRYSVSVAAELSKSGYIPVLLFNNWPHQSGVVRSEEILGSLLFFAAEVRKQKSAGSTPIFILDRNRINLATSPGPDKFDNRYFHTKSDLPAADVFAKTGITNVVYVTDNDRESDDLNEYIVTLSQTGVNIFLAKVTIAAATASLEAYAPRKRVTVFSSSEMRDYISQSGGSHSTHYYGNYTRWWSRNYSSFGGGGGSGFSS